MTHRNDLVPADATAVTTSDTANVSYVGFCCSVSGNIKVTTAGGTDITFTAWPAGVIVPLSITRVWATGTTATGIIGFSA